MSAIPDFIVIIMVSLPPSSGLMASQSQSQHTSVVDLPCPRCETHTSLECYTKHDTLSDVDYCVGDMKYCKKMLYVSLGHRMVFKSQCSQRCGDYGLNVTSRQFECLGREPISCFHCCTNHSCSMSYNFSAFIKTYSFVLEIITRRSRGPFRKYMLDKNNDNYIATAKEYEKKISDVTKNTTRAAGYFYQVKRFEPVENNRHKVVIAIYAEFPNSSVFMENVHEQISDSFRELEATSPFFEVADMSEKYQIRHLLSEVVCPAQQQMTTADGFIISWPRVDAEGVYVNALCSIASAKPYQFAIRFCHKNGTWSNKIGTDKCNLSAPSRKERALSLPSITVHITSNNVLATSRQMALYAKDIVKNNKSITFSEITNMTLLAERLLAPERRDELTTAVAKNILDTIHSMIEATPKYFRYQLGEKLTSQKTLDIIDGVYDFVNYNPTPTNPCAFAYTNCEMGGIVCQLNIASDNNDTIRFHVGKVEGENGERPKLYVSKDEVLSYFEYGIVEIDIDSILKSQSTPAAKRTRVHVQVFNDVILFHSSYTMVNKTSEIEYKTSDVIHEHARVKKDIYNGRNRPILKKYINSYIMGVQLYGYGLENDPNDVEVVFKFQHLQDDLVFPECSDWHSNQASRYDWFVRCEAVDRGTKTTDCICHTTGTYALAMSKIIRFQEPTFELPGVTNLFFYMGSALAALVVFLTLMFHAIFWKRLFVGFQDGVFVCFCLALFTTDITLITGMHGKTFGHHLECLIVSIALHFSQMAAFCLLLVDAYYMHLKVKSKTRYSHTSYFGCFPLKAVAIGFVVPAAVVCVTYFLGPEDAYSLDTDRALCFVKQQIFIYCFVCPAGAFTAITFLFYLNAYFGTKIFPQSSPLKTAYTRRCKSSLASLALITLIYFSPLFDMEPTLRFFDLFPMTYGVFLPFLAISTFIYPCLIRKEASEAWASIPAIVCIPCTRLREWRQAKRDSKAVVYSYKDTPDLQTLYDRVSISSRRPSRRSTHQGSRPSILQVFTAARESTGVPQ